MHEHNECEHSLKYCSKCDVVYCTKCKREWGGHSHSYYGYYPWVYPQTYFPWTTWTGTSGGTICDTASCDTAREANPPMTLTCNHC